MDAIDEINIRLAFGVIVMAFFIYLNDDMAAEHRLRKPWAILLLFGQNGGSTFWPTITKYLGSPYPDAVDVLGRSINLWYLAIARLWPSGSGKS